MLEKLMKKLVELFKSKNIEIEEKELQKELEEIINKDDDPDISKLDLEKYRKDIDESPLLKAVLEQNKILTQSVKDLKDALGKEQADREAAIKAAQEKAKAEREKKIEDTLKKALEEKKISEGEKEIWKKKLEKDFDWAKEDLDKMEVKKHFKKEDPKNITEPGKEDGYEKLLSEAKNLLNESITN
jgi:hypothetical protein